MKTLPTTPLERKSSTSQVSLSRRQQNGFTHPSDCFTWTTVSWNVRRVRRRIGRGPSRRSGAGRRPGGCARCGRRRRAGCPTNRASGPRRPVPGRAPSSATIRPPSLARHRPAANSRSSNASGCGSSRTAVCQQKKRWRFRIRKRFPFPWLSIVRLKAVSREWVFWLWNLSLLFFCKTRTCGSDGWRGRAAYRRWGNEAPRRRRWRWMTPRRRPVATGGSTAWIRRSRTGAVPRGRMPSPPPRPALL